MTAVLQMHVKCDEELLLTIKLTTTTDFLAHLDPLLLLYHDHFRHQHDA